MPAKALHAELLHSCPLACLACDHRLRGSARLTRKDLARIFSSGRLKDLGLISFSGGEPLLHTDLPSIVRLAGKKFPAAAIVVLSSLYDSRAFTGFLRALPACLLPRLHIGSSLDGPPPVHDRMRGRAGAFSALKASVISARRDFPFLSIGLTFTATSVNAAHFREAWLEARELRAPLGLQFLVPNPCTAGLELKAADKLALAAGLENVLAVMASEKGRAAPEANNLDSALEFLKGRAPRAACGAGETFFMLSPEGLFYLCPFHKDATATFAKAAGLRAALKGKALKACAGCFLRCAQ